MTPTLTRITPVVNGYAVVLAQKRTNNDTPGEFIGWFLQTPESPDNGEWILLPEAMSQYYEHISPSIIAAA